MRVLWRACLCLAMYSIGPRQKSKEVIGQRDAGGKGAGVLCSFGQVVQSRAERLLYSQVEHAVCAPGMSSPCS